MPRNVHKHLILAALATVLGLAACDSTSSSSASPLVDFSTTPSGWTRKTNYPVAVGTTADVLLIAPASQNFSANALVMTTPTSGISLSTAANSEIANTKASSTFSSVYVDSSKATFINGQSAWLIQIRYHYNTVKADLFVREILFVYKSKDCQIVFTRLQSDSTSANAASLRALEGQIVLN
jgi:hypothetical protein